MLNQTLLFNITEISPTELNLVTRVLEEGGIGVLPTDTIYGIVGSALNPKTADRIYLLRKRTPTKPFIILISSLEDLELFNIKLNPKEQAFLDANWPNPLSVILPCAEPKFEYLHRGTNSIAFRYPNDVFLLKIMEQTGPLVAPSANFEGEKPAETIEEAKNYFGNNVIFYIDGGTIISPPSTLVKLENSKIEIVRQGAYLISPQAT